MRDRITATLKPLAPRADRHAPRTGDHDLNGPAARDAALSAAAVLVPIVEHADGPTVLLTQRTDHLRAHAGQVSFPGGRAERGDPGPVGTALRETHEEIGLAPEQVAIAGLLDNYQTGTGFLVTPVVGFITPGFQLQLDPFEVAQAFEVPLGFLLDPANRRIESRAARRYYVFRYESHLIWGATAGMLVNLSRRFHGLIET